MVFPAFRKRVCEVTAVGRFLDNCFPTLPLRHRLFLSSSQNISFFSKIETFWPKDCVILSFSFSTTLFEEQTLNFEWKPFWHNQVDLWQETVKDDRTQDWQEKSSRPQSVGQNMPHLITLWFACSSQTPRLVLTEVWGVYDWTNLPTISNPRLGQDVREEGMDFRIAMSDDGRGFGQM